MIIVMNDTLDRESYWQQQWSNKCSHIADSSSDKPKFYNFDSAPFPNGIMHLGHARNYILGDIIARYKRLNGFNVLYKTNFDAFGLPNEIESRKKNIHPQTFTNNCIESMKNELKRLGISYDWSRTFNTSDPDYYRWTQWLFIQFFNAGLVYREKALVNWCESCQTVLSEMEAADNRCLRCGSHTSKKHTPQWYIRTSQYALEINGIIDELSGWSSTARKLLKGFIGIKNGKLIDLEISGHTSNATISVFIPESINIENISFVAAAVDTEEISEALQQLNDASYTTYRSTNFESYVEKRTRSIQRQGINTGILLRIPGTGIAVPLVIVNYIPSDSAAPVRACSPIDDNDDRKLAENLGIDIKSELPIDLSGITTETFSYHHARDWMVSRQKEWGTPLPLIHCSSCGYTPVAEQDLPIRTQLPQDDAGRVLNCPKCGNTAQLSGDSLDCYMDDIWCFFSSRIDTNPFTMNNPDITNWHPVDHYHGGYDIHTYLYLYLFLSLFLYDNKKTLQKISCVTHYGHDMVTEEGRKMSKRHNNATSLSSLIDRHGADTVRIAIMISANPIKSFSWHDEYLIRAEKLIQALRDASSGLRNLKITERPVSTTAISLLNSITSEADKTIMNVTKFIETYRPNSALQCLEKYTLRLKQTSRRFRETGIDSKTHAILVEKLNELHILIFPFAPHIAEELNLENSSKKTLSNYCWPQAENDG